MVDHLPDERLLSSAADSARQRRQTKPEDEEAVHSGKDTFLFLNITVKLPDRVYFEIS